jgi:lysophospholipase L1-like esterase
VIVLEGTNDIGMSGFGGEPSVTADALIAGYRKVILRVHNRGAKILLGTIPPFRGADSHYSLEKEFVRQVVNRWIRTSSEPDAVIDFDEIIRDPSAPDTMNPAYDSGDHLHPSDAGYAAMASALNLAIFD